MTKKLQSIRGMRDIFGEDLAIHDAILFIVSKTVRYYGYEHFETPIIEYSDVFHKTLGETSDIVHKETYTFEDRDGRYITLRPEFTSAVVRAFIENSFETHLQYKLFSYGPLFRHERPQRGRYRQFYQFNCEFINARTHFSDFETIALAYQILKELDLLEYIKLEINTLGDEESRLAYKQVLREYFFDNINLLTEDAASKIDKNPLRILDTKNESDLAIAKNAPKIEDYLNTESKDYYLNLLSLLKRNKINFVQNPKLVRGLDYYTHTVFEFTTNALGAQNALIAGGRYDKLIKLMGGSDIPAIGFAGGIDRIADLMKELSINNRSIIKEKNVAIIAITEEDYEYASNLGYKLRNYGIAVSIEYGVVFKKQLQRADKGGATFVIFIGEDERKNAVLKVRNMLNGNEEMMREDVLYEYLTQHLALNI